MNESLKRIILIIRCIIKCLVRVLHYVYGSSVCTNHTDDAEHSHGKEDNND